MTSIVIVGLDETCSSLSFRCAGVRVQLLAEEEEREIQRWMVQLVEAELARIHLKVARVKSLEEFYNREIEHVCSQSDNFI